MFYLGNKKKKDKTKKKKKEEEKEQQEEEEKTKKKKKKEMPAKTPRTRGALCSSHHRSVVFLSTVYLYAIYFIVVDINFIIIIISVVSIPVLKSSCHIHKFPTIISILLSEKSILSTTKHCADRS